MANVTFQVEMNNNTQLGQLTETQIMADLQGAGIAATAADPVFDQATGKLVRVLVNLPDTAAAVASQKINDNPGVATNSVPLPPAPLVTDLENITLASFVLDTTPGAISAGQLGGFYDTIGCKFAMAPVGIDQPAGSLLPASGPPTPGYNDGVSGNPTILPWLVLFVENKKVGSSAINLSSGEITLHYDGGQTLNLTHTAAINVPAPTIAGYSGEAFWVAGTGKLYRFATFIDNVNTVGPIALQDAVNNGPL